MRVLETGDWSLLLPQEWSAERDEDVILIGDRDGIGCLEISEFRKDGGPFGEVDLAQFTDLEQDWSPVRVGSFEGLQSALVEDDTALREWCVFAGDVLLYMSYSCAMEDRGMDDAAVDEILDTLRYLPE
jgi:hypothetical protein